ncbi:MAG: membrane integrity-associated transporter subunit PqiC [Rhizobiales bacterium]|nr:membrane integrity-associated transporter subunit PqiC [Hyphomicrobiales bacterium]
MSEPDRQLSRAGVFARALPPLLAAALAACTTILPQTPNAIYDLTAPGEISDRQGTLQVLVPEPSALQALDTDRIAARPIPSQYAYLPGAVWSDRLPKLLQTRLVQTLQNSGRVRAAAVPGQGLLIDYQIVMDIRAFELTGEGAVAEFGVKVMDDSSGRIVRSQVIRQVVRVAATDSNNVVVALDAAMDKAFLEIAGWALGGR